ncbi:DUF6282 family protein [Rhodococcus sp. NPDC059234]|uniref:DUF6282 family protein n=1 Tax=Rhodococcus sp. NPDC059234 TaxID=3346781 RepID=UPI00367203CB
MSGFIDFHVHSGPSLMPRHHDDHEIRQVVEGAGVERFVLKAHEGSTAERAILVGGGAIGSIVLNSPVGGANPDAVAVASQLGARVIWMPTISAEAHLRGSGRPETSVLQHLTFNPVPVCRDGVLLEEWYDVLDLVARDDRVLASGHIAIDEAVEVFTEARRRGVQRFLVNHPLLGHLGWRREHFAVLAELGAYIEVGVLADQVEASVTGHTATSVIAAGYPEELLVFGSDLGHRSFPDADPGIADWVAATEPLLGARRLNRIMTVNGEELLS